MLSRSSRPAPYIATKRPKTKHDSQIARPTHGIQRSRRTDGRRAAERREDLPHHLAVMELLPPDAPDLGLLDRVAHRTLVAAIRDVRRALGRVREPQERHELEPRRVAIGHAQTLPPRPPARRERG